MGVPSQRGKDDGLEKGPSSSSWQFQTATPGPTAGCFFFHLLRLLNAGMLLHRMAVQKIGPDSPMRPWLLKSVFLVPPRELNQ